MAVLLVTIPRTKRRICEEVVQVDAIVKRRRPSFERCCGQRPSCPASGADGRRFARLVRGPPTFRARLSDLVVGGIAARHGASGPARIVRRASGPPPGGDRRRPAGVGRSRPRRVGGRVQHRPDAARPDESGLPVRLDPYDRRGLRTATASAKWPWLSVTTVQRFASAVAATIMSRALRGRPDLVPSAMRRAQTRAARSSKATARPANKA